MGCRRRRRRHRVAQAAAAVGAVVEMAGAHVAVEKRVSGTGAWTHFEFGRAADRAARREPSL